MLLASTRTYAQCSSSHVSPCHYSTSRHIFPIYTIFKIGRTLFLQHEASRRIEIFPVCISQALVTWSTGHVTDILHTAWVGHTHCSYLVLDVCSIFLPGCLSVPGEVSEGSPSCAQHLAVMLTSWPTLGEVFTIISVFSAVEKMHIFGTNPAE